MGSISILVVGSSDSIVLKADKSGLGIYSQKRPDSASCSALWQAMCCSNPPALSDSVAVLT